MERVQYFREGFHGTALNCCFLVDSKEPHYLPWCPHQVLKATVAPVKCHFLVRNGKKLYLDKLFMSLNQIFTNFAKMPHTFWTKFDYSDHSVLYCGEERS